VATSRAHAQLHLDQVLADHPRLDRVVADRVRDVLGGEAVVEQHAALHVAGVLQARDHVRLVEPWVLAALQRRARPLGHVPIHAETAAPVVVEHRPNRVVVVTFDVEKVVEVGAREPHTLDDRGILDIGRARCPVDIKRGNTLPPEPGFAPHHRAAGRPVDLELHADRRALKHDVGKQRHVDHEIGQRTVEISFGKDFIQLVFGQERLVLGRLLGRDPGLRHQPPQALPDLVGGDLHADALGLPHLGLHKLADRLLHVVRHRRVGLGLEPPRSVGAEIHVAQERGGAATLGGDQPGVDLGAAELPDLGQLGRIVHTVEGAHRGKQSFRPPKRAVTVTAHRFPLGSDEAQKAGILLSCWLLGGKLSSLALVDLAVRHDAQRAWEALL
jgi:hypothetical protein